MRLLPAFAVSVVLLPAVLLVASGAENGKKSHRPTVVSFRETVEPIFAANCSSCHSKDAHSGGFVIDSVEAMFKGGSKHGAKVLVPGSPKASALMAYLRGTAQPAMPLGRPGLPESEIKQIETWIAQGAKIDSPKLGWPYTAPTAAPVPHVKNAAWVHNPIDSFVLAKLEAKGLKPSPPASKVALLRRVYADLVGEPPTPQEAAAFLNDRAPDAYTRLVDKLLADTRYGERWGRHWLDLVRYAESQGFENDGVRQHAWRYRDYVIRSFNADKPYDRFLKEQLAGDELTPNDPDALVATGFARLGPWDELATDQPQRWQDYLNDVTDTTGSALLGLTVGCARCHNHKYDRITQADYYRMQAFFTPTQWVNKPLPHAGNDPAAFQQKVAEADAHLQPLEAQMKELTDKHRELVLEAKRKKAKPGEKIEASDDEIRQSIERSNDNLKRTQIENEMGHWRSVAEPYRPIAEMITDGGKDAPKSFLLKRGNLLTPGPEVQPGFVASLNGGQETPAQVTPPPGGKTTGRRSALALWIASPTNPMTARVLVNRLWQHHFGRGIVGTPSDFGKNGEKATHRELLDWLAVRFMKDGWRLKKMHRLMLLSNTYQQSTHTNPSGEKRDPTNTLLWRMNRIRLEGEPLRDSILAVSGRLNPAMYGPGVFPRVSEEVLSTGSTHKWGASSEEEGRRRTVYVFQRRSLALPLTEVFDGPDMVNTCPRRSTTTIAPQALALFNGEFSRTEAGYFARRVLKEAGEDRAAQIERAYQIALIRRPTAAQKQLALDFLTKQAELHHDDAPGASKESQPQRAEHAALADFCHVLINTNEFLYLD